MKKSSLNVGVEIWVKWQMHIWCEAEGSHRRYENAILLKGWNNEMWKGANTQGLTLIFQICFADDLGENWLPTRCHNWTKKIWRATSELGRSDTWNWMRGIIIHKRPSQRLSLLFFCLLLLWHISIRIFQKQNLINPNCCIWGRNLVSCANLCAGLN